MSYPPPERHLLRAKDLVEPAVLRAPVPACIERMYGRPQHRTFRQERVATRG